MIARTFPHPEPYLPVIADAIRSLMAAAGAYGFHLERVPSGVRVYQASWDGVDEGAVAAAIAATPSDSESLRQRRETDAYPAALREALLALLDLLNIERAQHGRVEITPAQFIAVVKSRL